MKSKFIVKLLAYDIKMLHNVVKEISTRCNNSLVKFSVVPMPTKEKKFVILKSPFIYTIARDQFSHQEHCMCVFLYDMQPGQINEMFKDFNIPDGIQIKVKN